ncbi:hypothetical protein GGR54DRAFT_607945 [Hypoxylon sp. NC1633]|nr:hypothetical protein GGR54DRAFT_607945 [Hypoxylon sp. NC1633]
MLCLHARHFRQADDMSDTLIGAAAVYPPREFTDGWEGSSRRRHGDFAGILSHIDTMAIASLASEIMQARRKLETNRSLPLLPLPRIKGPLFGSAHVFYLIEFYNTRDRDTTKWIIKIPVDGTPDTWDRFCAETLRAEALTLFMLRVETHVPVPTIIDADSSAYNQVHAPYLIMDFVQGQTLDRFWYGEDGEEKSKIKERRIKVLESLARAMLQLGKYEFDHGGGLVFDDRGVLVGAGHVRELDVQAMIQRSFWNENCGKEPIFTAVGPFSNPAETYTSLLDMYPCDTGSSVGVDRLLRLLVGLIREPSASDFRGSDQKFVLAHPDLNMRNIIVSEEGNIEAILGWHGVHTAPKSIGNEAYPRWLVGDLKPSAWSRQLAPLSWIKDPSKEGSSGAYLEDAPWVLAELRDEYARIIQGLKKNKGRAPDGSEDVNVTKQSLLTLSLDTAARDPRCRTAILRRILRKCSRMAEQFNFDQIVELLGDGGQLGGYKRKCLERNFKELIDRGGSIRGAIS